MFADVCIFFMYLPIVSYAFLNKHLNKNDNDPKQKPFLNDGKASCGAALTASLHKHLPEDPRIPIKGPVHPTHSIFPTLLKMFFKQSTLTHKVI